jgi:S1-C subfamily serine protease
MGSGATSAEPGTRQARRKRAQACARGGGSARRILRIALLMLALAATVAGDARAASAGAKDDATRVKSGTGFFVSSDGFILTSAHVVAGCQHISIWQADGAERPSHIVAADRRRDVALLWMDGGRTGGSVAVAPGSPKAGEEVFTMGFGTIATLPLAPVLVEGSLVGLGTAQTGNRVLVIRARLHAGNSGGAVLAGNGSLVGMIVGRDEQNKELGIAIPRDEIEILLAAYGIRLSNRDSAANARTTLETISVLIQCSPRNGF